MEVDVVVQTIVTIMQSFLKMVVVSDALSIPEDLETEEPVQMNAEQMKLFFTMADAKLVKIIQERYRMGERVGTPVVHVRK